MEFLAEFKKINNLLFRFDTKIYLNGYDPESNGNCVGAIIGKHPGSATYRAGKLGKFAEFDLNGDQMLKRVGNRFVEGYGLAKKEIPPNSFVRVWNLFYVCDSDLFAACQKATKYCELPNCSTESEYSPIVWYGWGGGNYDRYQRQLNSYKGRFATISSPQQFYYNNSDLKNPRVIASAPSIDSFANHVQVIPSTPVNEHLAKIL